MTFQTEAGGLPADISLRAERPEDRPFLLALFASIRTAELEALPWTGEQKLDFIQQQFDLQWNHYRQHYLTAEWLVIERAGEPIGRLYLETTTVEVRLMDIALIDAERNHGLGTALLRTVIAHAERLGLPVGLHVEPFNPALHLYQRFGFQPGEMRGIYCFMTRPPGSLDPLS